MPLNKINQYKKIINKYNWILTDTIDDYYKKNTTERLELKKYCSTCKKTTPHKEGK